MLSSFPLIAQSVTANTAPPPLSQYAITESGPHHRVWKSVVAQTNSGGILFYHTNSFTELATGLNHLVNGQWVGSSEDIQLSERGASATNTQHQVYFAANLNTTGSIDLVTPQGRHLTGTVLGLSLFDSATGQSSIIAQVQDSIGQVNGNQVLYTNALGDSQSDFEADVLYTHKRTGFEQDVILHQQPPTPSSLGMNPDTTMLQVWTEFFHTADPDVASNTVIVSSSSNNGSDGETVGTENLTFGSMQMDQGNAFASDGSTNSVTSLLLVPVAKHWVKQGTRRFLVEEVPFNSVLQQLSALPPSSPNPVGAQGSGGSQSFFRSPAKNGPNLAKTQHMMLAKTPQPQRQGFVMDYNLINNNVTNFTFQGDTTYYLSGTVNLYGTTVLEGGAVLKCATGNESATVMNGNIQCLTSPYRPAIFTVTNDNSVGTILSASNNPTVAQSSVLYCPHGGSITNIRFSYAFNAVSGLAGDLEISDCQFVNCTHPITANSSTTNLALHNVLISMNNTLNSGGGALTIYSPILQISAEHLTADLGSQYFIEYYATPNLSHTTVNLTNSIIVSSHLNPYYYYGTSIAITPTTNATYYATTRPANLFQTVGSGSYYLATNSPALGIGTTNISPGTLADIQQKTTRPPIVYYQMLLTNNFTLYPQALRDTSSSPDLGYHYDPLDFALGWIYIGSNVTVTVTSGTAIAGFESNVNTYAVCAGQQGTFISQGAPTSLNHFVNYNTVQEHSTTNWATPGGGMLIPNFSDTNFSVINCRFTDFSSLAQDVDFFSSDATTVSPLNLQDCQLHGGIIDIVQQPVNFTNCLFERVNGFTYMSGASAPLYVRNSLFWGGSFAFYFDATNSLVQDNMFYNTSVGDEGNTNYTGGYNGYYATGGTFLTLTNTTDQILTSDPGYEAGPLGNYYLTNTSPLIDTGNTNANFVGLYHYTTQLSQDKESTSIVDIGYHYVALDSLGNPVDTDSDGFPDYIEDANGNGLVDSGETAWNDYTDFMGFNIFITRPTPSSNLP